ncbi:MAG: hypothetical protein AUJ92_01495 [Armatimonadetes bacterium CG2_30_59_28]|nr:MAG: hypothetical protein AUJ92_01495 [Armatimonadetes bacterium CG2_30_59_28]
MRWTGILATGIFVLGIATFHVEATPVVFWASDPIRPGETAMIMGEGFGDKPTVNVVRLKDGRSSAPSEKGLAWPVDGAKVEVYQANDNSVKFGVPAGLKPGVFAYRITGPAGQKIGLLNRPQVWWVQGDVGPSASPGGWMRAFGKCLPPPSAASAERRGAKRTTCSILLRGPRTLTLSAEADGYSARATLPANVPSGEYQVFLHAGFGGDAAWSAPVALTVQAVKPWPQKVFNVKDFGAEGSGAKDDTSAIKTALARAEENGGGVVFFPRGRYQLNDALTIPLFTVMRGEKREWVNLLWPDMQDPPPVLVKGTNSFGLEDLTFYCSNYKTFFAAGTKGEESGNVFLRRLRVRADIYRGHMNPEEVDRRYRAGLGGFGGGYWLATLGGRNVEVTDCDLYSSGCTLGLTNARGARIEGNLLASGRWGGGGVFGGDGVILADNHYVGADLMSWGAAGGLGYANLSHVYLANNTFSLEHGGDRESITSDAPGGIYYGPIASAEADSVTLPDAPKGNEPRRIGAVIHIVSGRGEGQWRRIVRWDQARAVVDRPWDRPPDSTATVAIIHLLDRWLVLNNDFSDVGIAVQFYGASIEHIVAGNRCARAGGFQSIGKPYGGYQLPPDKNPCQQPSWYCQFLDNVIDEGAIYRSGANNAILSGESVIGVFGWPLTKDWKWPYNRGAVVRGNRLENGARIHVGGSENELPSVRDVLVENNTIADSEVGVLLDKATAGVFLRGNTFKDVKDPLTGTGIDNAVASTTDLAGAELSRLRSAMAECGLTTDPAEWPEIAKALGALKEGTILLADAAPMRQHFLAATIRELGKHHTEKEIPFQTASSLLGLSLEVAKESTLPGILQAGQGGSGTLILSLKSARTAEGLTVDAAVETPEGWQQERSAVVPVQTSKTSSLSLPVTVPADVWGRQDLPIGINFHLAETVLKAKTSMQVGSGFLRDWMVIGPFENKTKAPLDLTFHAPEDGIDLKGAYDGKTGKVRWQPVHLTNDWLDLNSLYKSKDPGVAFAVACLRAEKETSVILRLGSSGGVAVLLNNQYLWSANTARKPTPDQYRVPINLRAGDNVLLFKVSTANDQWRFTAEVTPPPSGYAGRVQVIQPEQFALLPAFSPPPARPKVPGGEVKYGSGVDWRLVYSDDFERAEVGARWRVGSGSWKINGGILVSGGAVDFLAYAEHLPLPVRIEYDTRVTGSSGGDLSSFWLKDPANHGSGYLMGFGSNGNTCNKIMIDGTQVADGTRPIVTPGKWHHVVAQVLADGRVQMIVDDQLSINFQGPKPPAEPRFPGLWTWGTAGAFNNVRVFAGP